jgi:hypothetical protein
MDHVFFPLALGDDSQHVRVYLFFYFSLPLARHFILNEAFPICLLRAKYIVDYEHVI